MMRAPVKKDRPAPATRSVARRDMAGKELGRVDLPADVFGITPNEAVLHQVVTAQLAAARAGTQSTRTRAEVRGGGAKPFRQKGTGRARQGSTRSPLWPGGGIALGPKPRSYRQRTPKKMVRLALCSALSDRAATERVALVDAWRFDVPRTRDAVAALEALGLDGKVLVVLGAHELEAERSFGNLQRVQTVLAGELSAYDVLRNDWVVFSDGTLPGAETAGSNGAAASVPEAATGDEETPGVRKAAPRKAAPRKAAPREDAAKKAEAERAEASEATAESSAPQAVEDERADDEAGSASAAAAAADAADTSAETDTAETDTAETDTAETDTAETEGTETTEEAGE